ncbi:hypothetical protein mRhiFer1_009796 [Rhinolophus ferrumequinum]|uniref:Uncharacterized protein n=1 Tax=Rhinolophus ferrumequinum TaxID=59479 RepID=A0A7J7ZD86_RHIFE|nr:hypothetical protein mRhiFer1_009796 [Rhinolophus ferrumequinum]
MQEKILATQWSLEKQVGAIGDGDEGNIDDIQDIKDNANLEWTILQQSCLSLCVFTVSSIIAGGAFPLQKPRTLILRRERRSVYLKSLEIMTWMTPSRLDKVLRKEVCGHRSSEMTQGFAIKEAQVHLAMPFTNCVALSELRDLTQSWFLPRTNADNNYITCFLDCHLHLQMRQFLDTFQVRECGLHVRATGCEIQSSQLHR